jgi:hypothetical protein
VNYKLSCNLTRFEEWVIYHKSCLARVVFLALFPAMMIGLLGIGCWAICRKIVK